MTIIHVTPMQVDLKPLCGSVKQISWAEQIRATAVNHVAKHGNEVSIRRESYQAVLNILCTRLSAAWWIDRRGSICDLILSLKVGAGDDEIAYVAETIRWADQCNARRQAVKSAAANHEANKRHYY